MERYDERESSLSSTLLEEDWWEVARDVKMEERETWVLILHSTALQRGNLSSKLVLSLKVILFVLSFS